jgi:hypothetical protein
MATMLFKRDEVGDGSLPPVCARCGTGTRWYRQKTFTWHPPWLLLVLLFCGIVPGLILILIIQKRTTTHLPLCRHHRTHFAWRAWFLGGTFLAVLACFAAGVVLLNQTPPHAEAANGLLAAGVLGFLAWMVAAAAVALTVIRVTHMDDSTITLTGLDGKFVNAVVMQRRGARAGKAPEADADDDYERRYQKNRERRLRHQRRQGEDDV